MLRNYLAAAFGNMGRNGLYAVLMVAGLSLGFTAAILISLYARDEYSYDRFIPGHENVYLLTVTAKTPTTAPVESLVSEVWTAPLIKLVFPQIQEAARLEKEFSPPLVRKDDFRATEQHFYWADPGFFRVLPLPAVAGDLSHALDQADSLVITRAMARKYFGRDDPLGAQLQVNGHALRITAVLRDLPSNTHLAGDFYASSLSGVSAIKQSEKMNGVGDFYLNTLTYLRLRPGARAADLERGLPQFFRDRLPIQPQVLKARGKATETGRLVPLASIHLRRSDQGEMKPAGSPQVIAAIALIGVMIVLVASINFVTLMTARASRRAVEVGVRKAAGARRGDLMLQFIGEAVIYVALSMLAAVALSELLLPVANALLQRRMSFDYIGDPGLWAWALAVVLVVGLAAGAYPAFVLSSFRTAAVLKAGMVKTRGSVRVRQGLVAVQFAILVTLILATATIARQTAFSLNEGMRIDKDQTLIAFVAPCTANFRDQVRALRGVKAAGCSGASTLAFNRLSDGISIGDRRRNLDLDPVDFGFFDVYGVKPVAGRLFDRNRPQDSFLQDQTATSSVVLNQTAVRTLGFASADKAIGQTIMWDGSPDSDPRAAAAARPARIVGVVRDFTFDNVRSPIRPTVYYVGPKTPLFSVALHVKLSGREVPQTLAAIDGIWNRVGDGRPMIRTFTSQFMMFRYVESLIQGAVIAICALLALFIASLGLFGLSAFTAERRTKEIGVRKSLGASTPDVVMLLLWQFTQPILWANLIAWPTSFIIMDRWLHGFAYRVDQPPWLFVTASAAATVIAWATVSLQSWNAARAKPVTALRYE